MAAKEQKEDNDLSVFETIGTDCFGKYGDVNIKGCDHIVRLVLALQYYEALQRSDDEEQQQFFIDFIGTVYGESQVLNDWIHLMQTHSHQIEDIHDELMSSESVYRGGCTKGPESCTLFRRHYDGDRQRKHKMNNNADEEDSIRMVFLGELFDRIHHFLYHLFDTAMRTKRETLNSLTLGASDEDNDQESKDGGQGFDDALFAAQRQALSERREKLKAVTDQHDESNQNKFNITMEGSIVGAAAESGNDHKRRPFIDALNEYLFQNQWTHKMLKAFRSFLAQQQFDSDAVAEDICDGMQSSNLVEAIGEIFGDDEKECKDDTKTLVDYVERMKLSPISFSTGITWFYWESYKENIPDRAEAAMNLDDYGGYSAKELFVEKRYANYKEEILEHISLEQYNKLVVHKVKQFIKSIAVKKLKVNEHTLFYGLKEGARIRKHHVCSLVLYCDFTDFCRDFSATFRKLERWESIQSANSRNKDYYWQSRYFRETIELFGINGQKESGPFFCGIDCVMVIPSFCLRLCGPSSTSKQLEVAMNFAKESGVILQFNNNGHALADELPFFDVSWLSNYAEEDERIFCGGLFTIRLQSIRIVATNKNYQLAIHALFVLDCMLTGAGMLHGGDKKLMKLKKKEVKILKHLLSQKSSSSICDQYVLDTFAAYVVNKRVIKVSWLNLNRDGYDEATCGLVAQAEIARINLDQKPPKRVNMIRARIFEVFCFVEEYMIDTMGIYWLDYSPYQFDLMEFGNVICNGSWTRIEIQSGRNTWISNFWNTDIPQSWNSYFWSYLGYVDEKQVDKQKFGEKQKVLDFYGEKGFNIEFQTGVISTGGFEINSESLIITRK